jgi:hypothetical protein
MSGKLPLIGVALLGVGALAQDNARMPRTVLFIGDSLTYFNGGIYFHLEKLSAAAKPPVAVKADKSVLGGAFLHRLWDLGEPLKAIRTGSYEAVVLQEDIPETTLEDFREYARKFTEEIRRHNGRPVLLMAWAYQRLGWISMAAIAEAHRDAARELKVDVAPVGLAWERAARQRPKMDLFKPDREHPSIHGTYLAACVVYATLFGLNPSGIDYVPAAMSPEEAAFLQGTAWDTVVEHRANVR